MSEPYKIVTLDNGLVVNFYDHSNRYFGNFHRVCMEVKIAIPVLSDQLPEELAVAAARLGSPLRFERRLERMGVAGSDLQAVKEQLIADFLSNCSIYLDRPDFALCLLRRKLTEKSKQNYFPT